MSGAGVECRDGEDGAAHRAARLGGAPLPADDLEGPARHQPPLLPELLGLHASGKTATFVVQYPEERVDYPDAFRGMPVLVQLENGQPKCVACGLCEFACPTDCITIVPGELAGRGIERYPRGLRHRHVALHVLRPVRGGLPRGGDRDEPRGRARHLRPRLDALSTRRSCWCPRTLLKRRLDFLRGEYDRDHARRRRRAR